MPRFERGDESWEIALSGPTFTVKAGGETTVRKFLTVEQARVQYDKAILKQLAAGFVEHERAPEPGLDDMDAYLVHADALQIRGDPRGELIAIQIALHRSEDERERAVLDARARELLRDQHAALYGELSPHALSFTLGRAAEKHRTKGLDATWWCGAIRAARIATSSSIELPAIYAALRELPAAQHLSELAVGSPVPRGDLRDGASYGAFFAAIATHGPFPGLESLFLGDERPSSVDRLHLGDLDPVLRAMPRLRRLELKGAFSQLTLDGVVRATLPELDRLALTSNSAFDDPPARAIFDAQLPALRHLALHGEFLHAVPFDATLAASPLLACLSTLDLSNGELNDQGAEVLMAEPVLRALSHLEALDLRGNFLSDAMARQIRAAIPRADVSAQRITPRVDDDDRYDSIRE